MKKMNVELSRLDLLILVNALDAYCMVESTSVVDCMLARHLEERLCNEGIKDIVDTTLKDHASDAEIDKVMDCFKDDKKSADDLEKLLDSIFKKG